MEHIIYDGIQYYVPNTLLATVVQELLTDLNSPNLTKITLMSNATKAIDIYTGEVLKHNVFSNTAYTLPEGR